MVRWLTIIAALMLCVACVDDDCGSEFATTNKHNAVYKVAVIMPASQQYRWERTAKWALSNLEKAQESLPNNISLQLEWYDEEKEEGLAEFTQKVVADPSYKAIIGPMRTKNVYTVAKICETNHKTLILPQCTSSELQRLFAASPNVFHLTQSDIGQIEVMLSCARAKKTESLSMIVHYGEDSQESTLYSYGATFYNWLGFMATEAGISVDTVCTYVGDASLEEAVAGVVSMYSMPKYDTLKSMVLYVPERPEEMVAYDRLLNKYATTAGTGNNLPFTLCSDGAVGDTLTKANFIREYEGIDIAAAAKSGFEPAYRTHFGNEEAPIGGEAQLFDAIYMLSFALSINPDDLNNSIVRLSYSPTEYFLSWLPDDINLFFTMAHHNLLVAPSGVIGKWTFDDRYHSSLLTTTYRHWRLADNKLSTIENITLNSDERSLSSEQLWQTSATITQKFMLEQEDSTYGPLNDNYAIVMAASTGWANYRHQADALEMYHMLKTRGYSDDKIILIVEEDIADDARNIYPGEVKVSPNGQNLNVNVNADYKPSALSINDLRNIFIGNKTARTPVVLPSTKKDNVFVFWSGHGHDGGLQLDRYIFSDRDIGGMLSEMSMTEKFRKMFFVIESCYAGGVGEVSTGLPGLLVFAASNGKEGSMADMMNEQMGIWMSNGFTRSFREAVENDPNISLRNLYYTVAQQTVGSHATMYNVEHYGNMFKNTIGEFLKK